MAIVTVDPLEELLLMVTEPLAAPVVVGSNCRSSVADCPAFSVSGKVNPDSLKPFPVTVAEFTVTGPLPVDDSFRLCVALVFSGTLPKAILLETTVRTAVVFAALSCTAVVFEERPSLAVSVTLCALVTADELAVKEALLAPLATVTEAGTVSALELLLSRTEIPPEPAGALRLTVQESVVAPVSDVWLQENPLSWVP